MRIDENGKEVLDETKQVPVFMTDPFSQRNSTFFLYSPEFEEMLEFAETRDQIKSEITVKYLADCESTADTKTLYLVLWIVCLCFVVTLTIYN